jgi:carboxylate-amine ligase
MTKMLANPLWSRVPGSRTSVRPESRADLTFRPSPGPSLGVELELLVLDPRTRDLAPGSVRILEACAAESVPGVTAELMQSMIEVKTGVCRDVAEVRAQLVPSLRRMHGIAQSLGYGLALAGTHPFHQTSTSVVFPAERYERVLERLAWLAYQRVVFGLHVHVGVPGGDAALGVMTLLTPYLPHLLALSANSPYWHSADTGLASSRAALYNLLPHAGLPPYFGDWREFRNYCQVMQGCGAMRSFKDVYWDIRPRPDFGTVEVRICDAPATLASALGLVALTRCLVIWALRVLEEQPQRRRRDRRHNWIGVENKWLATRYGLEAPVHPHARWKAPAPCRRRGRTRRAAAAHRPRDRRRAVPRPVAADRPVQDGQRVPAAVLPAVRELGGPDGPPGAAAYERARGGGSVEG